MSDTYRMSGIRYKLCIVSMMLLILITYWLRVAFINRVDYADAALRMLRHERLQLRRAIEIINEKLDVLELELQDPVTLDSIKLNILEQVQVISTHGNTRINSIRTSVLTPMASAGALLADNSSDVSLTGIRVSVDIVVANAEVLINTLAGLRALSDWRPNEVRHCQINRFGSGDARESVQGLSVQCDIDFYHWQF